MIQAFKRAILALVMPVIILGGIYGGVFTPTEGGAFAAVYAIAVTVFYYRELSLRQLLRVSAMAARTTAVVMLIVGAASAVGWFITAAQIPDQMKAFFEPLVPTPTLLLLAIMAFLFAAGMVMDLTPNILLFAPVFYPLTNAAGIDPTWVEGKRRIGVTAGASAPEVLVEEVIARLKELSGSSVRNLDGVPERVTFPLPKELQDVR